jgi:hypothetical protein
VNVWEDVEDVKEIRGVAWKTSHKLALHIALSPAGGDAGTKLEPGDAVA